MARAGRRVGALELVTAAVGRTEVNEEDAQLLQAVEGERLRRHATAARARARRRRSPSLSRCRR